MAIAGGAARACLSRSGAPSWRDEVWLRRSRTHASLRSARGQGRGDSNPHPGLRATSGNCNGPKLSIASGIVNARPAARSGSLAGEPGDFYDGRMALPRRALSPLCSVLLLALLVFTGATHADDAAPLPPGFDPARHMRVAEV